MKQSKKIVVGIASALLLAATLCACRAPAASPESKASMEKEGAFITLDINPCIELVMDEERKITSLGAANNDAAILLWQEELIGMELEEAVRRVTELSLEMDYLTKDNATVSVTVITDRGKTEDALFDSIRKTIDETARDEDIALRVEDTVDLVLTKEWERVLEQNADKPGYDETLTLARYRLVRAALRADRELTMDEAVLMSNEALTETVEAAQEAVDAKFGTLCDAAHDEASFVYENAKQTLLDSAYTAVYASRRNLSSLLSNYGASYAGYRLAYRTVAHYGESLRALIENPILTSDDIFALANAIGINTSVEAEYDAFRAEIADEEGKVTRDSVNAYLNNRYKNMDAEDRARLEAAYDEVLSLFDRLQAEAAVIREDGMLIIRSALFGLGINLTVETYEDLPALLSAIEKKIDETYARMETDLTENEKADVERLQQDMAARIAELEKTYRQTMEEARARAEAYLTEAKAQRSQ